MRILITGSDGKIGRELVKVMKDHELLLVDKKGQESVRCNLATDDLLFIKDFEPEAIIHLAASFERTDETQMFHNINFEDNILATFRLNQIIAKLSHPPKNYIYASSYLIYDPMLYLSESPLVYPKELTEVDEVNPRNLIGASKLYGEKEIEFLKRNVHKSMKVSHARIFRVFGEGGLEFVSRLLEWKKLGLPVDVWKPENKFDYIHTSDCASALRAMLDNDLDGVFNVGTGTATSIKDILGVIKPKVRNIKMNDLYEASCASSFELSDKSGWEAKVDVIEWLKERV